MRVQLQDQNLRLRLQEDELQRLLAGEAVENRSVLPHGRAAVQRVRLGAAAAWQNDDRVWALTLPEADVRAYAATLPAREGLCFDFEVPDGAPLQVRFDVDVRDSARTRPRHDHAGD